VQEAEQLFGDFGRHVGDDLVRLEHWGGQTRNLARACKWPVTVDFAACRTRSCPSLPLRSMK
jgi:hypothetical protein